jgi:tetratricopeptide (TPR) repeat protein
MAAVALGAAMLGGAACATKPKSKLERNIEKIQEESTAEKLLARGRAFAQVGDTTRAEQYFAAALEQGADPKQTLPLLLDVCLSEGRYRVALDYAEPQLKKHPEDFRLRFVVASLYATIGETEHAIDELREVARTRPEHAEAHFALAKLLREEEGDAVGADEHFREYLRLRPTGPHADEARAALLKSVK